MSRGKDNSAAAQQVNTPQTKTNAAGVYVNIENLSIRSAPRGNVIADPAGWVGWGGRGVLVQAYSQEFRRDVLAE